MPALCNRSLSGSLWRRRRCAGRACRVRRRECRPGCRQDRRRHVRRRRRAASACRDRRRGHARRIVHLVVAARHLHAAAATAAQDVVENIAERPPPPPPARLASLFLVIHRTAAASAAAATARQAGCCPDWRADRNRCRCRRRNWAEGICAGALCGTRAGVVGGNARLTARRGHRLGRLGAAAGVAALVPLPQHQRDQRHADLRDAAAAAARCLARREHRHRREGCRVCPCHASRRRMPLSLWHPSARSRPDGDVSVP